MTCQEPGVRLATCSASIWFPWMQRLLRSRFAGKGGSVSLTISYDFNQGGRSDNVRPQRSQDYRPIFSTSRNLKRWATRLMTDPTARKTLFTTISRARTKRRPCSSSGATFSTGHSRRSALLLTGMRSALVSAFSIGVSLIYAKADSSTCVTDTWSHHYSEYLLALWALDHDSINLISGVSTQ